MLARLAQLRRSVGAHPVIGRLRVAPFETYFTAPLAIASGAAGLLNLGATNAGDALAVVIGEGWQAVFEALYLVAGLLILVGIASGRRRTESVGLVAIATSVAVRVVAYIALVGWGVEIAVSLVLYVGLIAACRVRLRTLRDGDVLILARHEPDDEVTS